MKSFYKKIVHLIFILIYGKIIFKKNILSKIKLKKIKINKNKFTYLYIIKNCRVFTDCNTNVAYIFNNKIIPNISYQQRGDSIAKVNYNSTLKIGTPKLKKKITGTVISLVQGSSCSNYWHWLYDIVTKLEIMYKNELIKKADYFYIPETNNFIVEILKHYGIKNEQLINSKKYRHISADKLFAIENFNMKSGTISSNLEKTPKWIVIFLKKKFLKYKKKFNCSNKVFIDRSDSKFIHFSIKNYKDAKVFFEKKGFRFYKLSDLSFYKQIYLFYNAKIIVGPHGAGFSNLVFCKKNTKVFEILPKNESHRNVYKKICKFIKAKHSKVITRFDKNYQIYLNLNLIKNIFN